MPLINEEELKIEFQNKIKDVKEAIESSIKKHDIENGYILQDVYDTIVNERQKSILNLLKTHVITNYDILNNTNSMAPLIYDENIAKQIVDIHDELIEKINEIYSKDTFIYYLREYNNDLIIPEVETLVDEYLGRVEYKNKIENIKEFFIFNNEVLGILNTATTSFNTLMEQIRVILIELRHILYNHNKQVDYRMVVQYLEEEELVNSIENTLKLEFPIINSYAALYYRYSQLLTKIKLLDKPLLVILDDIDNKNNYTHTLLNLYTIINIYLQYQSIYDDFLNMMVKIKNENDLKKKSEMNRVEMRKIETMIYDIKNFDISFLRNNYIDLSDKMLNLSKFLLDYVKYKVDKFLE